MIRRSMSSMALLIMATYGEGLSLLMTNDAIAYDTAGTQCAAQSIFGP